MEQDFEKIIADFESETGCKLEIIDDRPCYRGDLDLYGIGITSLPKDLTVGGFLDLRGTSITSLPEGLIVDGYLYLEDCTGITSLPEGLTVGGSIYLSGTGITSLPDGLVVGLDIDLCNTGITSLPEGLVVGGAIDLRDTGITSLPNGLTIGGGLDLEGCTGITSLPEGLTVGGYIDLYGTGITSLPDGLTVGGFLDLRGTSITSLPEGLTVGGYLDLRGTGITSLPDGLTVGGTINLKDCTGITSLPEGLTVGGDLDLRGTGITSLPKGLTIGESIYLRDTGITDTSNVTWTLSAKDRKKISDAQNRPITWKRDGMKYIKVDRIFTAVDSHHGNVYRVHKLGCEKQLYLVTDGDNHWAHGDTLQEARVDLIYKINDRDTSMYDGMTLDDTLTFEEAIAAYRTITGACSPGTRDYINNRLPKPHKAKYTIREIISLTEGEYGSERFMKFFKLLDGNTAITEH